MLGCSRIGQLPYAGTIKTFPTPDRRRSTSSDAAIRSDGNLRHIAACPFSWVG